MRFLFERLTQPGGGGDLKHLIMDHVQRLVGVTRINEDGEHSILNFGVPNVADMDRDSELQLRRYSEALKSMIECYEPRLRNVAVDVVRTGNVMAPLRVLVSGQVDAGDRREQLRFIALGS